MGCTNSKENTNPPTTIVDNNQQLINDHFRKWLKSNRPKADEYVLNDVISTVQQTNDIDDYRTIVRKALDLLSERYDIKTINKLSKLVQKEVSLASPKKVAHTIDILKQTAEKLKHGQIILDNNQQEPTTINGETTNDTKSSEKKHSQIYSGEPGIVLKEALEKARILFYKGKQAAIFANPNGGYDVRIIDDNDDGLNHDGNLLRSIIVTEVKMRPKPNTTTLPQFTAPPPPPPPTSKLLDENEISDDFRRSIDAALKGLEAIYHPTSQNQESHINKTSSSNITKSNQSNLTETIHEENLSTNINNEQEKNLSQTDVQPKLVGAIDTMNDIMLDTIETMTKSEIGNPIPPTHFETIEKLVTIIPNKNNEHIIKEHESKEILSIEQPSIFSDVLTSSLKNQETIDSLSSQEKFELIENNLSNSNIPITSNKTDEESIKFPESSSSSLKMPTSISQILEEHNKILSESSLPPVITTVDTNTTVKSPTHNVTYTEIIHSESHDGEQSRRCITESYDEHPSNDDDQTTSLKVVTKSEFSNHPSLGEKIMEQSVQVITVKVRNETIKTTNPSKTSDNDLSNQNDTNIIDMTTT